MAKRNCRKKDTNNYCKFFWQHIFNKNSNLGLVFFKKKNTIEYLFLNALHKRKRNIN